MPLNVDSDLEGDLVIGIFDILYNNVTVHGLTEKVWTMYDTVDEVPAVIVASEGSAAVHEVLDWPQEYTITVTVLSEPFPTVGGYNNTEHMARVNQVRSFVMYDDFISDWNAGTHDAYIHQVTWPTLEDNIEKGRIFRSVTELKIVASPTDYNS